MTRVGAGTQQPVALIVLGLTPARVGGIEQHTRLLTRRLADHDWRSVVCFLNEPRGEVREYLEHPTVTFESLPGIVAAYNWRAWRRLYELLGLYRPRVLHLHFTPLVTMHAWIAKLRGVSRILFTDHSSRPEVDPAPNPPAVKKMICRALTSPIHAVTGPSEYNCRALREKGFADPSRVQLIYNAADLEREVDWEAGPAFRQKHGIPSDRIVLVQVSSIIPEKGVADLIGAFRLALKKRGDLHLVIGGEGSHRDRYKRQVEEAGLSDHVTWTGLMNDVYAEGVFVAADIACQMSRWEEAFGFVIAEAMAHSRPVIGTRVGGIPEVIEDKVTGLLVGRGDQAGMADAILRLAGDPALREQFGKAGRERAERMFDLKKNIEPLVKLYVE